MSVPTRTAEEALTNAAFDGLLTAISWPGRITRLPEAGLAPIIAALIDRECTAHADDPLVAAQLLRTGARLTDLEDADFVFCTPGDSVAAAQRIRTGSDLYPDDGATLIVETGIGAGSKLRLTGPGIATASEIRLAGIAPAFWAVRHSRNRYPMGFDLVAVDGHELLALPRSTNVEVL